MKKLILPVMGIVMAWGFMSCSSDDEKDSLSEESVKLGIIGKWRYAYYDGQPVPTDQQTVATFHVDGAYELSFCDQDTLMGKIPMSYSVIGNTVVMELKSSGLLSKEVIASVSSERIKVSKYSTNYEKYNNYDAPYEYVAVRNDFSKSIVGIWQGEQMEGQQTYGNADHYWEFCEDGTYIYYIKDENGVWLPKDQNAQYVCDGDLLLARWVSNDSVFLECWNIDTCNATTMAWSALRMAQDGTTFTNTFRMKRVSGYEGNIMNSRFIRSKLQGSSWKSMSTGGRTVATNDREYFRFNSDGHGVYSTTGAYDWNVDAKFNYQVVHNGITIDYLSTVQSGRTLQVAFIDDDSLTVLSNSVPGAIYGAVFPSTYGLKAFTAPDTMTEAKTRNTYQRVKNDFSGQIVGLWEGVAMTGQETYGDFNHRWKYNSDGTYLYYVKNDTVWEVYDQETSEYLVSGDWLTTRWRKNAKEEMNLERWDIVSCDRDSMVWSAIRDRNDGTQYSTSITFKRIQTGGDNEGQMPPYDGNQQPPTF